MAAARGVSLYVIVFLFGWFEKGKRFEKTQARPHTCCTKAATIPNPKTTQQQVSPILHRHRRVCTLINHERVCSLVHSRHGARAAQPPPQQIMQTSLLNAKAMKVLNDENNDPESAQRAVQELEPSHRLRTSTFYSLLGVATIASVALSTSAFIVAVGAKAASPNDKASNQPSREDRRLASVSGGWLSSDSFNRPSASNLPTSYLDVEGPPAPALVQARRAFVDSVFGADDSDSNSHVHVTINEHPAVMNAHEDLMRRIEQQGNAKFTMSNNYTELGGGRDLMGFTILERADKDQKSFKETSIDMKDEDEYFTRMIKSLLPEDEGHTGATNPAVVEDSWPTKDDLAAPTLRSPSFESLGRRSLGVVGSDGRRQVSCSSAHSNVDYKQVVAFHGASSNWAYCTGTLISPDVVLTAAHCIHDNEAGGWMWPNRVSIRSCDASDTWREYEPRQMMTWTAWTRDKNAEYDMALVRLHSAPDYSRHRYFRWYFDHKNAGDLFGWKSFGYNSGMTTSWYMTIVGYPADKQISHGDSTMWYDTDDLCKRSDDSDCRGNPDTRFFRHMIDTWGAQSGSGVFKSSGSLAHVIYGVHAYSMDCDTFPDGSTDRSNCDYGGGAPRITSSRFLQMCAFIDDSRVC